MKKLFSFLFSLYGFAVFLLLLFIVFPLVCIASLFKGAASGKWIYKICTAWSDAAMFVWGMPHTTINAPAPKKYPVIFVFNHVSYMDIPVLLKSLRRQNIRILAKAEMASIPIFGYVYKKIGIMVDRSSAEARARSITNMKDALAKNISIAIAPEGTFNDTGLPLKEFYDGAFRLALEMQVPIQPVIFPDTFSLLNPNSVFSLWPGKSRAIFLEEVSPAKFSAGDIEGLKKTIQTTMWSALKNYKASWIK